MEGRRAPGYTKFNTKSRGDGEFVHLEAVAVIRERVKAWRAAGWPGITPVTRQLLERWCGVGQEEGVVEPRPFFCQLEAIETLIWLTEGAEAERQGLWGMFEGQLQGDGGPFERVCTKLCTGGGQTKPTYPISVAPGREAAEIAWPNIVRIDVNNAPELSLKGVPELTLEPTLTLSAQMAQTLGEWMKVERRDLYTLDIAKSAPRRQTLLFTMAKALLESPEFAKKRQEIAVPRLFAALVRLVGDFIASEKCHWEDNLFWQKVDFETPESRLAYAYRLGAVVKHLLEHLTPKERRVLSVVRDSRMPTRSTAAMRTWHTTKEPRLTGPKSQIGAAVYDSTWEQTIAETLAGMAAVQAYVRNDRHVGLRVRYVSQGVARTYIPDFIVRFASGETVVLEVKGMDDATAQDKHNALKRWCAAVTSLHDFGTWRAAKVRAANKLALLAALGSPA